MTNKIIPIGKKRKNATLQYRYPLISRDDISATYKLVPILYKKDEIQDLSVLFFHRLMKRNYGDPSEIEIEKVKKTKNNKISAIGKEWRYFLRTHSGGIILVGTEGVHSSLLICHLVDERKILNKRIEEEGKKLVADLLAEANRLKDQILNPEKEFKEGEGVQLYLLENVYLFNYVKAEMMFKHAEKEEKKIRNNILKIDLDNPEKMADINKFIMGKGMFYASAISYYFMALEGFVNLIYHSFLKTELNYKEVDLEKRLDIELKILLMPVLCQGFKGDLLDIKKGFLKIHAEFKNYRNHFFHSKIPASLKNITFIESGFMYVCPIGQKDKNKIFPFPHRKHDLKKEDVKIIKGIVDYLINEILKKMNNKSKKLVKEYILTKNVVPFWKNEKGIVNFGTIKGTKPD